MDTVETKNFIESGQAILGIEFGSTRIKAVLINRNHIPIASGAHDWENRLEFGRILLMIFGPGFRNAMLICVMMFIKNMARRLKIFLL